jgi:hypothetical protein
MSKKDTQREFYSKPRGTVQIESTKIRWFSGQSDERLDLKRGSQRHSKLSQLKGGYQARVYSDQMVLVMARQEAGPCERWPKTLTEELENNSRKPRDLVRKFA